MHIYYIYNNIIGYSSKFWPIKISSKYKVNSYVNLVCSFFKYSLK